MCDEDERTVYTGTNGHVIVELTVSDTPSLLEKIAWYNYIIDGMDSVVLMELQRANNAVATEEDWDNN